MKNYWRFYALTPREIDKKMLVLDTFTFNRHFPDSSDSDLLLLCDPNEPIRLDPQFVKGKTVEILLCDEKRRGHVLLGYLQALKIKQITLLTHEPSRFKVLEDYEIFMEEHTEIESEEEKEPSELMSLLQKPETMNLISQIFKSQNC